MPSHETRHMPPRTLFDSSCSFPAPSSLFMFLFMLMSTRSVGTPSMHTGQFSSMVLMFCSLGMYCSLAHFEWYIWTSSTYLSISDGVAVYAPIPSNLLP